MICRGGIADDCRDGFRFGGGIEVTASKAATAGGKALGSCEVSNRFVRRGL